MATIAETDFLGAMSGFVESIITPLTSFFTVPAKESKESKVEREIARLAWAIASPFLMATNEATYESAAENCIRQASALSRLLAAQRKLSRRATPADLSPPRLELRAKELFEDWERHSDRLAAQVENARVRPGMRLPDEATVVGRFERSVAFLIPVLVAAIRNDTSYSLWAIERAHRDSRRHLASVGFLFGIREEVVTPAEIRAARESDAEMERDAERRAARLQRNRDEDQAAIDWQLN